MSKKTSIILRTILYSIYFTLSFILCIYLFYGMAYSLYQVIQYTETQTILGRNIAILLFYEVFIVMTVYIYIQKIISLHKERKSIFNNTKIKK